MGNCLKNSVGYSIMISKALLNIWREIMIIFAAEIGVLSFVVLLVFIFGKPDVKDIKKSKLNKYQLWCVGLSGVLTCLNRGNYYSLEIDKKNDERVTTYKRILKTSWSITNKNDLLYTLDWLLEDGHNSEYEEIKVISN
jgi:hypothetical protein